MRFDKWYDVINGNVSPAGYMPGASIPLQKQLEHANQQSGFTDAVRFYLSILSHLQQMQTFATYFNKKASKPLQTMFYILSCGGSMTP